MYSLDADWRTWVCAVDASKKRVSLRFLYGVLLDDPKGVLRKGSSVLMTWDFAFGESVDAKAVQRLRQGGGGQEGRVRGQQRRRFRRRRRRSSRREPDPRVLQLDHERLQRKLRRDVRLDLLARSRTSA